ncbi:MAG: sulfatase [Planctomycetota bacterium]
MRNSFFSPSSLRFLACVALMMISRNASAEPQNVLFIILDDLRADVLGCYGDTVTRSPHLDQLASEGLRFDNAYCQGTWCLPSRRAMMRSQYVRKDGPTLGETLRAAGHTSVRVSKIFHMRVPGDIVDGTDGPDVEACWDQRFNSPGPEFNTPGDYACLNLNVFTREIPGRQGTGMPHRPYVTVKSDGDGVEQSDYKTATKAIELLREFRDQSFFLAVGLVRPHYPMVAPAELFEHYPHEEVMLPETWQQDLSGIPKAGLAGSRSDKIGIDKFPDNQKRMWSGYRASVEFADQQVGRILNELQSLGLDDQTNVIFTSDHGYHLADHTFWQKANLHEPVARVPLVIRTPKHRKLGQRSSRSLVELIDLYPTVCDLMEVETPEHCQGMSLLPVLENPEHTVRKAALTVHERGKSRQLLLRTDRYAYMKYQDGSEELYDMQADPLQVTNLANSESHQDVKSKLSEQLKELREQHQL